MFTAFSSSEREDANRAVRARFVQGRWPRPARPGQLSMEPLGIPSDQVRVTVRSFSPSTAGSSMARGRAAMASERAARHAQLPVAGDQRQRELRALPVLVRHRRDLGFAVVSHLRDPGPLALVQQVTDSVSRASAGRRCPAGRWPRRSVRSVRARPVEVDDVSPAQRGRTAATRRAVARDPADPRLTGIETWITELTPLSFLERSAAVHPDKVAVLHGPDRWTYRDLADRVQELATALRTVGVGPGDRVAYLLPNLPEMLVAHFAVPLAGAVLVTINTRLSPEEVHYICDHSGSVVLVVDAAFAPTVAPIAGSLETVRTVVTAVGPHGPPPGDPVPGSIAYSDLLAGAASDDLADDTLPWAVDDERATISINYRSGTTGRPKGVVYCHRGPTWTRWATCCTRASPTTASTCGRCRCSTATAGARRGRWSRSAAPRCACARSAATRSGS